MTALRRLAPGDRELRGVLALIRAEFAYMDGRIDPPSSMHRLTLEKLSDQALKGEVWAVSGAGQHGETPQACVVFTDQTDALYIGKLAVRADRRGAGLARALIDQAHRSAGARGLRVLRLESRVELTEVHAAFARLGFHQTGTTAHDGYDRPTSILMEMAVCVAGDG